ncbi:hypothetical protein AJ79_02817 [Helicocarpus griseus UAMH5409]|uniref:Aminoglycoside phosphotransferase domain-containing protein n=1 Tax=Helicocarpus griseus UAMH5409 TaxID=1447875 RepID=A0A2B7Y184_9EURO|nr:hypothetical protein AJ79_02817 [Helicocarpus griseus UAMH5409]
MFQAIDAEPRILVHEDFHAGNMLVRDGQLVGIMDWEFSVSEVTEEEEEKWNRRYHQDLEKLMRQKGWSEENIRTALGDGWPAFQKTRTVMFPEDNDDEGREKAWDVSGD